MKIVARRMLALGLSLCTVLAMSPVTAQAQTYSYDDADDTLSYSHESEYVVSEGEDVELSVSASTTEDDETYYEDEDTSDQTSNLYTVEELQLDNPVRCEKTADGVASNSFLFTPAETGYYIFLSAGTVASNLSVYNGATHSDENRISGGSMVYSEEYGKNGGKVIALLTAGNTYAVYTDSHYNETGFYSVSVQKYEATELSLSTEKRSYSVDDKSGSTTLSVTASTAKDDVFLKNVTYQWYVYDPEENDYVPLRGGDRNQHHRTEQLGELEVDFLRV